MEHIEAAPAKRAKYEYKSVQSRLWWIIYRLTHPNVSQVRLAAVFQEYFRVCSLRILWRMRLKESCMLYSYVAVTFLG